MGISYYKVQVGLSEVEVLLSESETEVTGKDRRLVRLRAAVRRSESGCVEIHHNFPTHNL